MGSIAARRRISRRTPVVARRAWPLIQGSELVGMVMAAVPLVEVDAAGVDTREPLEIGDHGPQRVAVERLTRR